MAKKDANRAYRFVLEEHRRKLQNYTQGQAIPRLRKLYDLAQLENSRKMQQALGKGNLFTAWHKGVVEAQLRQGQALLAKRMSRQLAATSTQVSQASIRDTLGSLEYLEAQFTGTTPVLMVDEAAIFGEVIPGVQSSLLSVHETSMQRYGARLVGQMQEELALSILQGETIQEAAERLEEVADLFFWQAERIARTELSWADGLSQMETVRALREGDRRLDDPGETGLFMRWNEYIDDNTWQPMDDRVAVDSEAMHGQVVIPGMEYTCPATTVDGRPVPNSLIGKQTAVTPIRPNGREALQPWMQRWGIPGWLYVDGERVWLVNRS